MKITSFGYLHHDVPPVADLLVDASGMVGDATYFVADLRAATGREERVVRAVMDTPSAPGVVSMLCAASLSMLAMCRVEPTVAIGSVWGRHRAVVLADQVAHELTSLGWECTARHLDVDRPLPLALSRPLRCRATTLR